MAAVAGVIAEYNPFHRGHAYQLAAIRQQLGEDTAIVAVMSGNFVQRGECAVMEKHARARCAVLGGADLVLELPTVYAAATAETFARGGVTILAESGVVSHLCFGSESGDLEPLKSAALCLDSEEYHCILRTFLEEGLSFAAARQAAAEQLIGDAAKCLASPNNNLGVEYLRANNALVVPMTPVTIRRVGAAHDSGETAVFSSASAIRQTICSGEAWQHLVPEGTANVLEQELEQGRAPSTMACAGRSVLYQLRRMNEEEFRPYDGGEEGLYRRFYKAVRQGTNLEEILALAKTKRYSHARLRRMALSAWLGLEPAPERPPYLRVLAANKRGCALLKEMKDKAALPVVTKSASVRKMGKAADRFFAAEAKYTDLYALCCPAIGKVDSEYTTDPVIL